MRDGENESVTNGQSGRASRENSRSSQKSCECDQWENEHWENEQSGKRGVTNEESDTHVLVIELPEANLRWVVAVALRAEVARRTAARESFGGNWRMIHGGKTGCDMWAKGGRVV